MNIRVTIRRCLPVFLLLCTHVLKAAEKTATPLPVPLPGLAAGVPASGVSAVPTSIATPVVAQPAVTPSAQVPAIEAPVTTSAPIAAATSQPPVEQDEQGSMYLNFDNASLASVVNYLAEQKKLNLFPHKDLENLKVSLSIRTPLTLECAWDVVKTLLEINNFSMVQVGDQHRVVANRENGREPLPTYSSGTGTEPEQLPHSDTAIRYVYFFRNIKAETARAILGKLLDERSIIANNDLNVVVVKDLAINIKAAFSIVKQLDLGGLAETIRVLPLTWVAAEVVEKLFQDILGTQQQQQGAIRFMASGQKESAYFSPHTRIKAESIRNQIILLGTQSSLDKVEAYIKKYLDVPPLDAESRLHIKEVRYMRAEDLKKLLEDLVEPPRGTDPKVLQLEGGYKAFEDVLIGAERSEEKGKYGGGGNRLLIACNQTDWLRIEKFIDKLDKPQPQIAIEMMVIDVSLDQQRELSTQFFQFFGRPFGAGIYQFEATNMSSFKASDPNADTSAQRYIQLAHQDLEGKNAAFVTLGRAASKDNPADENIWAIIKTILQFSNSHIISQPYLILSNNQEGVNSSVENRRVPDRLDTGTVQTKRSFTYMKAETTVKVTPHINLEGLIDMQVDLAVQDFLPTDDPETPSTNNRSLVTRSTIRAGEVLVLGGLTRSVLEESMYKTPVLGDIPILGTLFKGHSRRRQERNLYIFLRPTLIKPSFEGDPDEYTQLKLDYAKLQIMKNDHYAQDSDPIQRWFFKPSNQTIAQRMDDARRGILRPIDNYTYGKSRPREVDIAADPAYRVSEELEKVKQARKAVIQAPVKPLGQQALTAMLSRPTAEQPNAPALSTGLHAG